MLLTSLPEGAILVKLRRAVALKPERAKRIAICRECLFEGLIVSAKYPIALHHQVNERNLIYNNRHLCERYSGPSVLIFIACSISCWRMSCHSWYCCGDKIVLTWGSVCL